VDNTPSSCWTSLSEERGKRGRERYKEVINERREGGREEPYSTANSFAFQNDTRRWPCERGEASSSAQSEFYLVVAEAAIVRGKKGKRKSTVWKRKAAPLQYASVPRGANTCRDIKGAKIESHQFGDGSTASLVRRRRRREKKKEPSAETVIA